MGHESTAVFGPRWPALDALVSDVLTTRRQISALQAREARLLSDAVDLVTDRMLERRQSGALVRDADLPLREVSAELGAAMRVSDRAVQRRLGHASSLVTRFPATHAAWEAGLIDAGHADAVVDAGVVISDDERRARYETRMLEIAAAETPTRMREIARAVAAQIDPESVAAALHRAEDERCVRVIPRGDGIARVLADLPAALAYAVADRLTQMARDLQGAATGVAFTAEQHAEPNIGGTDTAGGAAGTEPEVATAGVTSAPRARTAMSTAEGRIRVVTGPTESATTPDCAGSSGIPGIPDCAGTPGSPSVPDIERRTMDQLRADIFVDLLLAGAPAAHGQGDALSAITAVVHVTIPVLTLAGVGNEPALLAGYGPIDSGTARRLAAGAPGWDRVMTHPYTGAVLAVDRYRPNADLTRFLRARDERCRAPGCTRPAVRCDIDHTIDAARGGATADTNLEHLCRRHHVLRHDTAWDIRQLGGGVLEWTSPTGRTYLDRPPATLRYLQPDWTRIALERTAATSDGLPPPF